MEIPGADRGGFDAHSEVYVLELLTELVGLVTTVRRAADPELSEAAVAPTREAPIDWKLDARVAAEAAVSERFLSQAEGDGLARRERVRGRAEAELASLVVAPAPHAAVLDDGAAIIAAEADGVGSLTEVDGRERVAHLTGFITTIGRIAEAELADMVAAPAFQRAVFEDRAGVIAAGADRLDWVFQGADGRRVASASPATAALLCVAAACELSAHERGAGAVLARAECS